MDHFEPYLRKRMVEAMFQSKGLAGSDSKNGIAPRAALLTALWGDEPSLESSSFTCFRKRCVRSPEYCGGSVMNLALHRPSVLGIRSTAFHTLFFQVQSV